MKMTLAKYSALFKKPALHKSVIFTTILLLNAPVHAIAPKAPELSLSDLEEEFEYVTIERVLGKLDTAFYTTSPEDRGDGNDVGQYPDKASIEALAKEIAAGQHAAYDSLLVAHKDRLLFESYYSYGRVDLPHYQASATKGYTSMAIGRAIQLGYLTMEDLHKPVLSFLTDIDSTELVEGVENITLHHTLSMRSGLRVDEDKIEALEQDPDNVAGQKLAQAYFTHSDTVTTDAQRYHYQPIDTRISMLVLDAVVPDSAQSFIKTQLLDKLGITQYFWQQNVSGVPEGASRSSMTSRDMLKWGQLLKDQGQWMGEQLISEDYLKQGTGSVAIPTDDEWDYSGYRYGYYFWGTTLNVGDKAFDVSAAWGGGTQMVISIPELDLVIVVTARARAAGFDTLALLAQRVLPAFVK